MGALWEAGLDLGPTGAHRSVARGSSPELDYDLEDVFSHLNQAAVIKFIEHCSEAIDILDAYEGTLEDDYPPENERCEHGEMLLYKIVLIFSNPVDVMDAVLYFNRFPITDVLSVLNNNFWRLIVAVFPVSLLEECGLLDRALEEMYKKEAKIVDKLAFKEQLVSILDKLGRVEDGEKLYRSLLLMNPDNYSPIAATCHPPPLMPPITRPSAVPQHPAVGRLILIVAPSPSTSTTTGYCSTPADARRHHRRMLLSPPIACLHRGLHHRRPLTSVRIPLDFLEGEKFHHAADNYVRPLLTKGVPSLFSDLSPLYDHCGKADILEQLFVELETAVKSTGCFPGRDRKEPPSTLLWILFLLSQHYERRGQHGLALVKIDEAIKHTPTVIDLYSIKGRVLKHAGDLVAAAALADEARSMDLADRYLNSECVLRMLEADQVGLADKTAVLFTKDGDQHNNLHDMQCMWYELASGESYFRQGDLGRALKKFLAVEKHYADMTEDQFDFHSYCLRKMTLRAYVSMLKFQDQLHSHSYFHSAATGAIRSYIKLYDSPLKPSSEEDGDISGMLPAQKRKFKQKQKKAEARAKKEAEERNEEANSSSMSKSGKRQHAKPVDLDPHGEKLLQVEHPLLEATKYLKLLQNNSSQSLETHILSFELNMRKQKVLLAFQIKFFHRISSLSAPVTDLEKLIWNVLEAERRNISQLHGKSLVEVNKSFLEKHKDSLMHRVAAAEMLYLLEPDKKLEAIQLIQDTTNDTAPPNGALGPVGLWRLEDCISVHKLLEQVFHNPGAARSWKARCAEYFPYSTYFEGLKSSAVVGLANGNEYSVPENGDLNHQSFSSWMLLHSEENVCVGEQLLPAISVLDFGFGSRQHFSGSSRKLLKKGVQALFMAAADKLMKGHAVY
ncbi:peptide alpha-N-acetyltransferase [Dendrobium catenatum]|uniref:Peptide alpha-N-acetyltransferase n=1 Tax=Dendrobium catenatum TaxID=906689 RepID=A0A2I0W9H5_9ASPA|nr:peptide alpha-N-acetyltransferase [Dendrobium catenatum]